jgi:hypothetical protein
MSRPIFGSLKVVRFEISYAHAFRQPGQPVHDDDQHHRTTGTGNTVPAVQLALRGDFPLPISHQIPAISARPSRIRGTSACSFGACC